MTTTATLVATTRPADVAGDLLDHLGPDGFAWLGPETAFVTSGVASRIEVPPGRGRIDAAAAEVASLLGDVAGPRTGPPPGMGPLAVGALPFSEGEPGELLVPEVVVGRRADGTAWITEVRPASHHEPWSEPPSRQLDGPELFSIVPTMRRAAWRAGVARALDRIATAALDKVVLAREVVVEADRPFSPRAILSRLRAAHPSAFTFAAGGFVGASPELLVSRRGDAVRSAPMAGTAPRGGTLEADRDRARRLATTAKERAEHRFVVDAVVEALDGVCSELAVADTRPEVLTDVIHLCTEIRGRLADPAASALSLAGRLHPSPAVSGTPAHEALELIGAVEVGSRGRYAGPVGWVDGAGNGEWVVGIRSAHLQGRRARLWAGAGIVTGSDPDAEWEETQAKLATMLSVLVRP